MSSYGGRRPLGCIHSTMLPGPRTSVSFLVLYFLGILGGKLSVEVVSWSSMWRFGWGLCQEQKLLMRRGMKRAIKGPYVRLDCICPSFFLLVLHSKKIIKRTSSEKHMPAGLLFFNVFSTVSRGFLFYLVPTRYPFISKHKKRSSVFSAAFQIQWLFTALFWFMST